MPKQKALPVNQAQSRSVAFSYRSEDGDSIFNEENRTLELSFSSEAPVERWFGQEVLQHSAGCMRHGTRQTSMSLLFNHNRNDVIGVVESIWIEESRGYARVRFAKNDRGNEVFELVKDGILTNVSFAYWVYEYQAVGEDQYFAKDWEPLEISIVTVPADASVGIGRSMEEGASEPDAKAAGTPAISVEKKTMPNPNENHINVDQVRESAVMAERTRIAEITAMCAAHGIEASQRDGWISTGTSIDDARAQVLTIIGQRTAKPVANAPANPDFHQCDLSKYSVVRAINAFISGDWSKAGMEREMSQECERLAGRTSDGFFMPTAIRAAYNTGTPAAAGNLVANNLMAGSFIDMLRNNAIIMKMGASVLSGLVGNVSIPRQTGSAQTYWVEEGGTITESEGSFDLVPLTPKTVGALSMMTRQMLQQSTPDIEMLVRNDLAKVMALAIDSAAISGSGQNNEPTGIINTIGVGTVTGLDMDGIIDLETEVAAANADADGMAYLAHSRMIGALKKLKDEDKRPIWYQAPGAQPGTPGQINGYNIYRTNQMPNNKILFGNFRDLIVGQWGALEILPNIYGTGYRSGGVEIRAMQTVNIALRHAASFAVASAAAVSGGTGGAG